MEKNIDERWMRLALSLGSRGSGQTWPNPFVGCVIVKDSLVVGRGFTQKSGRPHAEIVALAQASRHAKDSTVYVTLEPCIMCAGAVFWAQIGKVVYGAGDDQRGFMKYGRELLHPKTKIEYGVLHEECSGLLRKYFQEKRV